MSAPAEIFCIDSIRKTTWLSSAVGMILFNQYGDDEVMEITNIRVQPEERGKGHGSRLMKAAAEYAKSQGVRQVRAYDVRNERVIAALTHVIKDPSAISLQSVDMKGSSASFENSAQSALEFLVAARERYRSLGYGSGTEMLGVSVTVQAELE